jgi:excinuclease UvrABC nuclease subunit
MQWFEKEALPHSVYRMFSADGTLLYVGCSKNPLGGRIGNHGSTKPWCREVCSITLTWFPTYMIAARAEAKAILTEAPKYNLAKVKLEAIGMTSLRKAARRPRGDGATCPRCNNPKEDLRPGKAYCRSCYTEYQRVYRLKKLAAEK